MSPTPAFFPPGATDLEPPALQGGLVASTEAAVGVAVAKKACNNVAHRCGARARAAAEPAGTRTPPDLCEIHVPVRVHCVH